MQKLKLVKQIDECGCSIACLAMVTGKPYFYIRTILHEKINRLRNIPISGHLIGLHPNELCDILLNVFKIPCQFIKFISFGRLKSNCILLLCPITGSLSAKHAVVFDATNRRILDPDSKCADLKEYNVYCCIELE